MGKIMASTLLLLVLVACKNETNQRKDNPHISNFENSITMENQTIKTEMH